MNSYWCFCFGSPLINYNSITQLLLYPAKSTKTTIPLRWVIHQYYWISLIFPYNSIIDFSLPHHKHFIIISSLLESNHHLLPSNTLKYPQIPSNTLKSGPNNQSLLSQILWTNYIIYFFPMKARKNSITSEDDLFTSHKSHLRNRSRHNLHTPSFHEIDSYKIDEPILELHEEPHDIQRATLRCGPVAFKKKGMYCLHERWARTMILIFTLFSLYSLSQCRNLLKMRIGRINIPNLSAWRVSGGS